jgi:N6-L-threonylcarbamoyladenine synthase
MLILGIETSCDETAVSVARGTKNKLEILSNVVSSQVKLHAKWGGVVPNLASREHLKNIAPVFSSALKEAGVSMDEVDLMAVTNGPGLIPALLIGTNFAKALSFASQKPLLGIHHIEGHIYANFINANQKIKFPVLALVVSGGHTQLILMKEHLKYEIIGETLDDAAGEAFDKVARMMNVGYPGGPAVAKKASEFQMTNLPAGRQGVKCQINLPRPMINSKNFNFSFSGLKTAVLYLIKKIPASKLSKLKPEICFEFQQAVIDVLVSKTLAAAKLHQPKTILLAGGVSANSELRKQLGEKIKENLKNTSYIIPDTSYSVDNAGMIAAAGYFRYQKMTLAQRKKLKNGWKTLQTSANLKLQ